MLSDGRPYLRLTFATCRRYVYGTIIIRCYMLFMAFQIYRIDAIIAKIYVAVNLRPTWKITETGTHH